VHLRHIGHPIVCDHLYGDVRPLALAPDRPWLLDRLALHAHRLELPHPVTGEPLVLQSALPDDMARAADALEAHDVAKARSAS
jgi:23S rRNA-/tRNA-specific pseudouridylate synthase